MTQGSPYLTGLVGATLGVMGLLFLLALFLSGIFLWRRRRRRHTERVMPMAMPPMPAYDLEDYAPPHEPPRKI
ncbi:hypothetical protein LY78DRAFT_692801 [Colletotrichum sublineola]|nr:hypothetical protein LY78DRAFT_692801 [Colletotrichum sublineola]